MMDQNKKMFIFYLALFISGVLEMGTMGKVVAGLDMGVIGVGVAYIFGAGVAVIINTLLGLGVIVGLINTIRYYKKWNKEN